MTAIGLPSRRAKAQFKKPVSFSAACRRDALLLQRSGGNASTRWQRATDGLLHPDEPRIHAACSRLDNGPICSIQHIGSDHRYRHAQVALTTLRRVAGLLAALMANTGNSPHSRISPASIPHFSAFLSKTPISSASLATSYLPIASMVASSIAMSRTVRSSLASLALNEEGQPQPFHSVQSIGPNNRRAGCTQRRQARAGAKAATTGNASPPAQGTAALRHADD